MPARSVSVWGWGRKTVRACYRVVKRLKLLVSHASAIYSRSTFNRLQPCASDSYRYIRSLSIRPSRPSMRSRLSSDRCIDVAIAVEAIRGKRVSPPAVLTPVIVLVPVRVSVPARVAVRVHVLVRARVLLALPAPARSRSPRTACPLPRLTQGKPCPPAPAFKFYDPIPKLREIQKFVGGLRRGSLWMLAWCA